MSTLLEIVYSVKDGTIGMTFGSYFRALINVQALVLKNE